MLIYLGLALFLLLIYYLVPKSEREPAVLEDNPLRRYRHRKYYCVFVAVIIILFMGLRGWTVGTDTWNYRNSYYQSYYVTDYLWKTFVSRLGLNFWSERGDLGYLLIAAIFNRSGLSFNVFLTFCSALLVAPVSVLIYRYSVHMGLSFFWLVALILGTSMCSVRSEIAWGLSVIAFLELQKGKKLRFWLFVIIASLVHITGIVFVGYYFIRNIKVTPQKMIIVLAVSAVVILMSSAILGIVTRYTYVEYSELSLKSLNTKLYIFFALTALISALAARNLPIQILSTFSMMLPAALILFGISSYGAASRLFFSFSLYSVIIIPNMFEGISDSYAKTIGSIAYFITGIYLIAAGYSNTSDLTPYVFYWQLM